MSYYPFPPGQAPGVHGDWQGQVPGQVLTAPAGGTITLLALQGLSPGTHTLQVQEYDGADRRGVGVLEWGLNGSKLSVEFDIRRGVTMPLRGQNFVLRVRNEGSVPAQYSAHLSNDSGTSVSSGQVPLTRTFSFDLYQEGTRVIVPRFAIAVLVITDDILPPGNLTFRTRDRAGVALFALTWPSALRRLPNDLWVNLPPISDTVEATGANDIPIHFEFALQL